MKMKVDPQATPQDRVKLMTELVKPMVQANQRVRLTGRLGDTEPQEQTVQSAEGSQPSIHGVGTDQRNNPS